MYRMKPELVSFQAPAATEVGQEQEEPPLTWLEAGTSGYDAAEATLMRPSPKRLAHTEKFIQMCPAEDVPSRSDLCALTALHLLSREICCNDRGTSPT